MAGTRIPVESVLELVHEGLTFADITRDDYPDLSPHDIQACIQYAIDVVAAEDIRVSDAHDALAYAYDHPVEMDEEMAADDEETVQQRFPGGTRR